MDKELLVLAGAGVAGFIGAGYLNNWIQTMAQDNTTLAVAGIVGGAVALAVPLFVLKSNEGWGGPVRVILAVAGILVAARGVLTLVGIQPMVGQYTLNIL